jgi:hypothetical protein
MADVTVDQLRAEVRKLLVGIDLKTFTIGWAQLAEVAILGMSRLLAMKWIHMGEEPAVPAMTEFGYCFG